MTIKIETNHPQIDGWVIIIKDRATLIVQPQPDMLKASFEKLSKFLETYGNS